MLTTSATTVPWEIKMLYDGDCPLCMREVDMLKARNPNFGNKIKFVDIADPAYDPAENEGVFLRLSSNARTPSRSPAEREPWPASPRRPVRTPGRQGHGGLTVTFTLDTTVTLTITLTLTPELHLTTQHEWGGGGVPDHHPFRPTPLK